MDERTADQPPMASRVVVFHLEGLGQGKSFWPNDARAPQ